MATLRDAVVSRGHGLAEQTVKVDEGVVENAGHINFLRVLEGFVSREVVFYFFWVEFAVFIPS
jgi:hypothetical protein